MVVDNRAGANGTIGTAAVIAAPADGYTLLVTPASTHTLTPLLGKVPYDPIADLVPIGMLASTPLILLVNPEVPAKTVPELVAWIKSRPGKVSFGSYGNASASHLAGELFKQGAGVDMVHVAYKGGAPAQMDLIGGQISLMFSDVSGMQHVRSGKLKAIAVTSAQPAQWFPDLPTVAATVPGFDVGGWFAAYAPVRTPQAIVDRLSAAVEKIVRSDAMRERLVGLGLDPMPGGAELVRARTLAERDKWTRIIAAANIKV